MSKAKKALASVSSFAAVAAKATPAAIATRGASSDADGSGAPSIGGAALAGLRRRLTLAAACVSLSLAALLLSAPPALAATVTNERPLLFTFDGSDTTAGAFKFVNAVEIDQAGDVVYVIDQGHNVLDKFNLAGIAQDFAATGQSSLAPGFAGGVTFNFLSDLAVDNSATNPGRIHALRESGPVKAFGPTGASLWEIGFSGLEVCGLAVDSEGHPWVGDFSGIEVREYANSGSPPAEIGSFAVTAGRPCRLDVDASGNVYVTTGYVFAPGGVDKYVGGVRVATLDPAPSYGVTVDQSSPAGHIFTLHERSFNEYESSGTLVKTFGADLISRGLWIAYDQGLDRVYVSDRESETVKAFGPAASGTVPDVTCSATSEIGVSKAKANCEINPLSVPNSYHFEWKQGTGANWGTARSQPSPYPSIEPTDSSPHAVSFAMTRLKGSTTYQVRLVGTNTENGLNAYSSPSTFTTLTASPPTASIDPVSSITVTTADVSGTVNPRGDFGTTWWLETSTDPACASGFSERTRHSLESEATSPVPVSEELTGLLPSQHYCVRLKAENGGGTATSVKREFVTLPVIPTQVFTAFAAPRTDTTARLNGYVNPEGANSTYPLTYHFDYSADGGETWTTLPDQTYTGGARESIVVGQELTGLAPGTTYSYRFLAESEAGEASPQGEDKTFATRSKAEIEEVTPPPGSCPNEDVRLAQHATYLPDCRAFELVNNPDKGNQNVFVFGSGENTIPTPAMTPDGGKALWHVLAGAPGGNNGARVSFLARRTPSGWRSSVLQPPPAQQVGEGSFAYGVVGNTPDLSRFVFQVNRAEGIFLVAETTLIRVDDAQNQDVLGVFPAVPTFAPYLTDDAAHVLYIERDTERFVDIGSGTPEVVNLLPDGTQACLIGEMMEGQRRPGYRPIAATDASRVYFVARSDGSCVGSAPMGIYVRNRETAETTMIDPGSTTEEPEIIRATPDGRHLYFVTKSQLDPADANSGADVYRWDEAAGESACLTCVVPDARLAGGVAGAIRNFAPVLVSDDFSHIYFESYEQLVPGRGRQGKVNVYALTGNVRSGDAAAGQIRHVAWFFEAQGYALSNFGEENSLLSSDGNVLLVLGQQRPGLTADAVASGCPQPGSSELGRCDELYRYDDRDGSLECVSCLHGGLTTQSVFRQGQPGSHLKLSGDGSTVAFTTAQALVPLDVNRDTDVYEWRHGVFGLITDGVSDFQLGLASPQVRSVDADGDNILFQVVSPGLTGFERDGLSNAYVARIGGGFEPPSPPAHCIEDSCQGPLQAAPALDQPASGNESRGNVSEPPVRRPCRKGKVRRHGKCLKKRHRRRHYQRAQRRAANHHRGGVK